LSEVAELWSEVCEDEFCAMPKICSPATIPTKIKQRRMFVLI
jgi:hypothetical protein